MGVKTSHQERPWPLVSKRQADWDGLSVAHYRFRAGELPEHSLGRHLLVVSMSRADGGEIRTASGFRARTAARGGVCLVPAGQPFAASLDEDAEHLVLYLDPSLVLRAAADGFAAGGVELVEQSCPRDLVVSRVGLTLLSELETEAPGRRLYAESLANVLAVHLLRHYTSSVRAPQRFAGGLAAHRLRRVLTLIEDRYDGDLSLEDLAAEAGMSVFHFAREFKRATGTTPHQHLIKFRVERAKGLLSGSEMPLAEVALCSGFGHQSHFSRLFRKLTGATPHGYRLATRPTAVALDPAPVANLPKAARSVNRQQ